MIGLDTNVLVRYFAQDDPIQSALANELIEHRLTVADPGYVSLAATLETVWVLKSTYGLSNQEASEVVEQMLASDTLFLQNEQEVSNAVEMMSLGGISFQDALIGALDAWAGCAYTLTFDRKASRFEGFKRVQ